MFALQNSSAMGASVAPWSSTMMMDRISLDDMPHKGRGNILKLKVKNFLIFNFFNDIEFEIFFSTTKMKNKTKNLLMFSRKKKTIIKVSMKINKILSSPKKYI
jgi:hypothetical protein